MRIALVADEDPGWGGIGTYTGVLGTALAELGHDVRLVLRGWEQDGIETLGGLTVHRVTVPEPSWRRGTVRAVSRLFVTRESLQFSARVARLLCRLRPEVVEAAEFHAPALVAALRTRLGFRAPPVIVRLHAPSFLTANLAGEPSDLDLRAGEGLESLSAHCARLISSPSTSLADRVAVRWRVSKRRIRVVPNPIDDSHFTPGPEDAPAPGSILVVGRVERNKGQDLLVEALPAITRQVPDARLHFVGADGGSRKALQRRADALGVGDVVTFAGPLPRLELPAVYRSASVCVVPSRFEAFSYTALEAMASGRPVVAARTGGLPEMIDDGRDGILVEPESSAALAAGITGVLVDRQSQRRLGSAARERVLSSFAAHKVAAWMVETYAEVIR